MKYFQHEHEDQDWSVALQSYIQATQSGGRSRRFLGMLTIYTSQLRRNPASGNKVENDQGKPPTFVLHRHIFTTHVNTHTQTPYTYTQKGKK